MGDGSKKVIASITLIGVIVGIVCVILKVNEANINREMTFRESKKEYDEENRPRTFKRKYITLTRRGINEN